MVGPGFAADATLSEDCAVSICGVIKYSEDKVGALDVLCVLSPWEKDPTACCDGTWDTLPTMRRGFFATGVIIALTPCMEKGKLEAAEMGTPEAEAETVVPIDEATGAATVLIADSVGFTAVEACVYTSIGT